MKSKHEMGTKQCTFGDGGYYYHDGMDRVTCNCGWTSIPIRTSDKVGMVALFKLHLGTIKGGEKC